MGLCDERGEPEHPKDKRYYTIAQACSCRTNACGYCQGEPHIEVFAKELTRAEAETLVKNKALCLECGG